MIRRAAPADIPALVALEAVFPTDRMSTRNFQESAAPRPRQRAGL